ncbi:hypothetical protein SAMN05443253_102160 [Bacillus sp. OK048]|nr:hypothetical protein SAMN05443253_102160 [Bacillus sp. OK048]
MATPLDFKTDWAPTDYYNFSDLNRLESNIEAVRSYIVTTLGIPIPTITVKKSRTLTSTDYLSDLTRIESNIETIRLNYKTPPTYRGTMFWNKGQPFSYREANRLEINTKLIWDMAVAQGG